MLEFLFFCQAGTNASDSNWVFGSFKGLAKGLDLEHTSAGNERVVDKSGLCAGCLGAVRAELIPPEKSTDDTSSQISITNRSELCGMTFVE